MNPYLKISNSPVAKPNRRRANQPQKLNPKTKPQANPFLRTSSEKPENPFLRPNSSSDLTCQQV